VARAFPLYIANATYQEPRTGLHREIVVLGVDPRSEPFALPELQRHAGRLAESDTAIMDEITRPDYEPVAADRWAAIDDRRLRIVATYRYGTGLIADASIFVSDETFSRFFPQQPPSNVSIGLAKLESGADLQATVSELQRRLPADVEVLSRHALEAAEQHTWVRVRPVGIMFTSGVALAFAVGAVIIYQILSLEITNRLKEYATLKAIGHRQAFIRAVVIRQALLYAALGIGPGLILAYAFYAVFRPMTNLPMVMTWSRISLVSLLAVTMAVTAASLAIRRVAQTDPADLFG
jgi:putative ABC transport system permease protein